ncbi:hypothetical protein NQZ68_032200 [Dissostichus eleginoides]|nr:hypothetical protein NQZ68_032200 [Dissostichus eleginoides]
MWLLWRLPGPVSGRIKEDHTRIILPSIDNIKHGTFKLERYENSGHGYNWELWCMYINPPQTVAGRGGHIGSHQDSCHDWLLLRGQSQLLWRAGPTGMEVYGGENTNQGIRVWLCGGSMEVKSWPLRSALTRHSRRGRNHLKK